jgi:hypothetical protein
VFLTITLSLTLVDSLSTLLVLGDVDEFREAVKRVINVVSFDKNENVSVFETTIRYDDDRCIPILLDVRFSVLGGLLSAHLLIKEQPSVLPSYNDQLLHKAVDLADRLIPAFDTPTVHSLSGHYSPMSHV